MADRGLWGMHCFNALSPEQQRAVVEDGYLPFLWSPEGDGCNRGAEVEITTTFDKFPGPRFYCLPCAVKYLEALDDRPS
jgi:hypothetical protein